MERRTNCWQSPSSSMGDSGRERTLSPRLLNSAILVMQLLCCAGGVAGVLDFYVWNGLSQNLKVGDQSETPPGQFLVYTKDAVDIEYTEYMVPTVHGLENENCEIAILMMRPDFRFRNAGVQADGSQQNDGWVVYVYEKGFFGPSDNLGNGQPVYMWPPQICWFDA